MAFTHIAETELDASPEQLFDLLADVTSWPKWDDGITAIECSEPKPRIGTIFFLTPKGGPRTKLKITEYDRPRCLADIAYLPLGQMLTRHELLARPNGKAALRMTIRVSGPLGFLWNRVIARKQIAEAAEQAQALAAYARAQTQVIGIDATCVS